MVLGSMARAVFMRVCCIIKPFRNTVATRYGELPPHTGVASLTSTRTITGGQSDSATLVHHASWVREDRAHTAPF